MSNDGSGTLVPHYSEELREKSKGFRQETQYENLYPRLRTV